MRPGDHLKMVQAGDPFRMPAMAYNAFVEAAVAFQGRRLNVEHRGERPGAQRDVILIKNSSGADRGRFDVLGVSAPIITPTDNLDEFKNAIALTGITPATDTHIGKFVILLEPIASGKIGLACVDGVCVAKIDVGDEDHRFAEIADAQSAHLASAAAGSARILWVAASGSPRWAVIRIGVGGVMEGTHATPYEMLPSAGTRCSELTAQTDTWDRDDPPADTDGVLWHGPRVVYDVSAEKYYLFDRAATHDSLGTLVSYAAESKREITYLEDCTTV